MKRITIKNVKDALRGITIKLENGFSMYLEEADWFWDWKIQIINENWEAEDEIDVDEYAIYFRDYGETLLDFFEDGAEIVEEMVEALNKLLPVEDVQRKELSADDIYDALKDAEGKGYWDKIVYSVDIDGYKYSISYTDRDNLTGETDFPDGCVCVVCRPSGSSRSRNAFIGKWISLDNSRYDIVEHLIDTIEENM